MLSHGADLVLVDGALDRVSSASPAISDASVLATGAVLSRNMDKVIEMSLHQVALFGIPALYDEKAKALAEEAVFRKAVQIVERQGKALKAVSVPIKTALGAGRKISAALTEQAAYVLLPGSLVARTLFDIAESSAYFSDVTFVVQDATKLFVEPRDWQLLLRKGLKIAVVHEINLLAVTLNPYAPAGYYFDPALFQSRMQDYMGRVPVIDVMESGGQ